MCNPKKKKRTVKRKKCWFLRALDRVNGEFDEMGDNAKKILYNDLKINREIDKSLGLSSEIKNAKRFL